MAYRRKGDVEEARVGVSSVKHRARGQAVVYFARETDRLRPRRPSCSCRGPQTRGFKVGNLPWSSAFGPARGGDQVLPSFPKARRMMHVRSSHRGIEKKEKRDNASTHLFGWQFADEDERDRSESESKADHERDDAGAREPEPVVVDRPTEHGRRERQEQEREDQERASSHALQAAHDKCLSVVCFR